MAHFKTSLLRISAFTALILSAGISTAHAGFQWSPPSKSPVAPALVKEKTMPDAGPVMPAMPQAKVDSADLTKMPVAPQESSDPLANSMDDMNGEQAPAPAAVSAEKMPVKTEMPMPAPSKAVDVKKESGSTYADAVGFGSDMPLALAMRQIVPPQYAFVFDPSVKQGAKVTWNGGKPWDITLNETLKPLGYTASIDGNTVRVHSGETAENAPEAAPAPVPAPAAAPVEAPAPVMAKAPTAPAKVMKDAEAPAAVVAAEKPVAITETPNVPAAGSVSKAVREVYVRRNSAGTDVEERVPGKPENIAPAVEPAPAAKEPTINKTPAKTAAADSEDKHGFWHSVNPANWGTAQEVPKDQGRIETVNTRTAAEGKAAAAPVPEGPDAKPDVAKPVMLTQGPGPVEQHNAAPAPAPANEAVSTTADIDPAKQPTLNAADVRSWEAAKGASLKDVLKKWSDTANVQLYWVPAQDYKLKTPIKVEGSYTDAVSSVLASYGDKGSRPVGRLHPNMPNGPAVLIIEPSSS